MKLSGFRSLLFLVALGAALAFLNFLSSNGEPRYFSDLPPNKGGYGTAQIVINRKLKENDSKRTSDDNVVDNRRMNLDDYVGKNGPYKAIRTEPVEHGTPFLPFLPRPPPPDLPSPGDY